MLDEEGFKGTRHCSNELWPFLAQPGTAQRRLELTTGSEPWLVSGMPRLAPLRLSQLACLGTTNRLGDVAVPPHAWTRLGYGWGEAPVRCPAPAEPEHGAQTSRDTREGLRAAPGAPCLHGVLLAELPVSFRGCSTAVALPGEGWDWPPPWWNRANSPPMWLSPALGDQGCCWGYWGCGVGASWGL